MGWLKRLLKPKSHINFKVTSESLTRLSELTDKLAGIEDDILKREIMIFDIANNLNISIWAKDNNNRYVYANEMCRKVILRISKDEDITAALDTDFGDNVLAHACIKSDEITKERGKTCRFIEHCVYNGTTDLWVDVMKSPHFDGGELVGTVGSGVDITGNVSNVIKEKFKSPATVEVPIDWIFDEAELLKLLQQNGD